MMGRKQTKRIGKRTRERESEKSNTIKIKVPRQKNKKGEILFSKKQPESSRKKEEI